MIEAHLAVFLSNFVETVGGMSTKVIFLERKYDSRRFGRVIIILFDLIEYYGHSPASCCIQKR